MSIYGKYLFGYILLSFFSEVRFWRLGSLFFIAVTIEAMNEENTYFKVLKSWSSMTCRITVAAH